MAREPMDCPPWTPGSSAVPFREGIVLLWSYSRPHLRTLLIGVLLGLFTTAITPATPMVTEWVLDSLGTDLELAGPVAVLVLILIIGIIGIIGIIANLAQSVLLGRLSEHIVLDARRGLVSRFFLAKLEQIQRFRTGELVTRMTSDTLLLREATTNSLVQLINGLVSLVGTIVLMALLDWRLLLTTLLALVVVGGLFGVLIPQICARYGSRRWRRRLQAGECNWQSSSSSASAQDASRSVSSPCPPWLHSCCTPSISWTRSSHWPGHLPPSRAASPPLRAFAKPNTSNPKTRTLALAPQLLTRATLMPRCSRSVRSQQATPMQTPPTLRDVTLAIPRTGHIALVGPSGAGKTTVFSLLLRFIEPTSGRLELNGVPYDRLSIDDVRSGIAYANRKLL